MEWPPLAKRPFPPSLYGKKAMVHKYIYLPLHTIFSFLLSPPFSFCFLHKTTTSRYIPSPPLPSPTAFIMITPLSPDLQSQPYEMPGGIVGISEGVPCLISCKCPFVLLQYLIAPHSKSLLNLGWNSISALWSSALSLKTKTFNC